MIGDCRHHECVGSGQFPTANWETVDRIAQHPVIEPGRNVFDAPAGVREATQGAVKSVCMCNDSKQSVDFGPEAARVEGFI